MSVELHNGDCLEVMRAMPDNSIDAVVTDPPYGISFMAKKWDYDVPAVEVWREALRVLKPGGHALIACGTRTQHRMVCNIEDAGFEVRDVVSWIYGSGFPKSLNISKAIDKAAGAAREVVGVRTFADGSKPRKTAKNMGVGNLVSRDNGHGNITAPATPAAKQWDGWGTALKPACEFFTLCRKPLSEKTVAANVLRWGTGGINIDGCRVEGKPPSVPNPKLGAAKRTYGHGTGEGRNGEMSSATGRFPANLIHDGSQEVLEHFPVTKSGSIKPHHRRTTTKTKSAYGERNAPPEETHGDQGTAARFFYCAKASKKDRGEGNTHPTVKPTALMRYLCRLITPVGGTVLDPYMGSGSTGKAAMLECFGFVGIERDTEEGIFEIAQSRIYGAVADTPRPPRQECFNF